MTTVVYEINGSNPFQIGRLRKTLDELNRELDISSSELDLSMKAIENSLPASLTVNQLLELVAETLAQRVVQNPDFALLAGRVEAYRVQRLVVSPFSSNFSRLENGSKTESKIKMDLGLVSKDAAEFVARNSDYLDKLVRPERDMNFTYFGMRTLCKSYFLQIDNVVAETPQYLFLRVAIGLHGKLDDKNALQRVSEIYDLMSEKYFIFSSPTLFSAGTNNNFLSSCFLMGIKEDSIDGIFKTLHSAALISKGSGGLGIHVHNIRSNGSAISSSNGTSNGLVPMLKVFNNTARYVDQGGNKRPGAFAIYIEPWHGDIMEVLELRKNHGPDELRARDLFFALWIPDLFMKRVKNNGKWSLFSPSKAPGLSDVYGEEFESLYQKYEEEDLACTTIEARKLWMHILQAQTETGMPFMLYKDACNRKSNQMNLGTIKSSNLCCEIVEYSSPEETAVCNLASLGLPTFVTANENGNVAFDFKKLHKVTKILARSLDRVIDVTKYPIKSAKVSNLRHRPIAIGVQGLADTFLELRLPFDSAEAATLNSQIFETIYHAAIESSMELSKEKGYYESFEGSPASKGKLQFDLWNYEPDFFDDWDELKEQVKKYGLRNSLLVAAMPTASTSQILGFNECFEPFTSNIYNRRVLSGEFQVVNKYLVKDLRALGIWNKAVKDMIIMNNGSVQNIDIIPQELKKLYKTVWEISQKHIVRLAADRGRFIDQSQSMNIHLMNPTYGTLTSCHFFAWEQGLKTGMYYLRTQAAARAIQFTVDKQEIEAKLKSMVVPEVSTLPKRRYISRERFSKHQLSSEQNSRKRLKKALITPSPADSEGWDSVGESQVVKETESFSSVTFEAKQNMDDDYNIHDSTPLSCNISDIEGCDACSG
ncbi:putative ribonucleoside-diphosphate reductase [Clavispora lusitaniae]|uniref:Ribonucleoside-diphosphate reductase n=1 Tax=Clavispora lusitaniae TaxID=36911 RepID=A0AA91PV34_CLALS|nr:putative ribonucleoside-diphosphate reductase [Clavispora lusitaniae]